MELPAPFLRLVPELGAAAFPEEPHATCASCAMAPRPGVREGEPVFAAPARCCTYHPRLVNFLAGRALRRGGIGAERVAARIRQRDGVRARGIDPSAAWERLWDSRGSEAFGRDPGLNCPFWVEGTALKCAIYDDRNVVCRTWHCKLRGGGRGYDAWMGLAAILGRLERELSTWCVEHLPDVPADEASPEDIERFYVACADRVDALSDTDIASFRTPRLALLLRELGLHLEARDLPMPDVLQPRIQDWIRLPTVTILTAWSSLDRVDTPPWIFELLSRLDGVRPWREAVAETARALNITVPESLVRMLWDRGLVGPPVPFDGPSTTVSILPGDGPAYRS